MWLTKKWWFLIVAVPIIGLCVKAGFWQLDRADQKEDLIRALAMGESSVLTSSQMLNAMKTEGTHQVRLPVTRDTSEPLLFLDNRIQGRIAGYEVFTEVTTRDGAVRLLTNLGWVPGLPLREELPSVEMPENFELKGLWVPVTESYLMGSSQPENLGNSRRIQSLTDVIVGKNFSGMILADGLLPRNAVGPAPRLGPETHYGYAVQWFLLAVVLVGMTVFFCRRGISRG